MSKHIHRYQRVNIGQGDKEYFVMKCNLPGCSHYTAGKSKLSFPLLRGQVAICNRCEETFVLNKRALRMEKPCCDDCVKHKEGTIQKIKSADAFFEEMMNDVSRIKVD